MTENTEVAQAFYIDDNLGAALAAVPTPPSDTEKKDSAPSIFGGLTPELGQFGILLPFLLGARGGKYSGKIQRGLAYLAAGQLAYRGYKRGQAWWIERREAEVLPDQFMVFTEYGNHLSNGIIDACVKQMSAENAITNDHALYVDMDSSWDEDVLNYEITLKPDEETRALRLTLGGHNYHVEVRRGKPGAKVSDTDKELEQAVAYSSEYSSSRFQQYLIVAMRGREALNEFEQFLQTLLPESRNKKNVRPSSQLMTWDTTRREWVSKYGRVSREMDSVALREGQVEVVLNDIDNWLQLEAAYEEYGLPWRRGVLLYGPPGGGKTSFVTALSSVLGLDIYYINLQGIKSNDELVSAIRSVEPRSTVVFEDVDVVAPSREGNQQAAGVTLDGLLSVMDGMLTPHGAVFVLTTNHIESLDPALIRPGRIDVQLEIGFLDDYQASKMTQRFFGRELDLPSVGDRSIMPASLAGIFKKYLHDREAALPEVLALLSGGGLEVAENAKVTGDAS